MFSQLSSSEIKKICKYIQRFYCSYLSVLYTVKNVIDYMHRSLTMEIIKNIDFAYFVTIETFSNFCNP